MRISDWSSDVCSSDLGAHRRTDRLGHRRAAAARTRQSENGRNTGMNHITLDQANKVIEGAFAKAKELHLKPLGVVVLDAGGHPRSEERRVGQGGVSTCSSRWWPAP